MRRSPAFALLLIAAAAAPAAADDPQLSLAGQLFAGWSHTWAGDDGASAFDLGRAELGLGGVWRFTRAELRLDAVRSASPESLQGVAGDALVIRVKRAWGGLHFDCDCGRWDASFGLLQDPWLAALEPRAPLRPLAPLVGERAGFLDTSDFGVQVGYERGDWLRATVTLHNGEGLDDVERNQGKDTTAVVTICPWQGRLGPLGGAAACAHVGARDGSRGPASARDHRLEGAITLAGTRLSAGAEAVLADGVDGNGLRDGAAASAWLYGAVWEDLAGGWARIDAWDLDRDRDDSGRSWWGAGAWLSLDDQRFRLLAGIAREHAGVAAPPAPGAMGAGDATVLLIVLAAEDVWNRQ